jgi:aminoglycoside phosphotransferase family enzyme/predicted kinase
MPVEAQTAVVEWLKSGTPWNEKPEVIETHAALIFLVGDRAYKLKKAVDLGYLNFLTLEARRTTLERELTLNRRTAPKLYLRTLPISSSGTGFNLSGEGRAVDYLLEMRRFPNDALLSACAERNELSDAMIERLARHIAAFHDEAERVELKWPEAVDRIADENTLDLRSQIDVLRVDLVEAAILPRDTLMRLCRAKLEAQSSNVRRCHGDVHLGNIFLDHDQPTLFDCIEFDEFYAAMPPLYDVAFLLMDLIARGQPRLANRALNSWLIHLKAEAWPPTIEALQTLPLYLALRSEIRAKTEARKPNGRAGAQRYLQLARKFGEPSAPRLVAIGGFSGTGKSTLAKEIAWRLGAPPGALHLRSDEIRKSFAGIRFDQRLTGSAYSSEATAAVYSALDTMACTALLSDQSVVVDAVFARQEEREAIRAAAEIAKVPFTGLWLEAPRDILEQRLTSRRGDVSDADVTVLHKQLTYDLGHITWHHIDAGGDLATTVAAAMHHLS